MNHPGGRGLGPEGVPGTPARAVVLTGGQSLRMGRDKAWVRVGGRACVERVWTACRAAFPLVEFQGVVPGLAEAFPGTALWADPAPALGPLAALAAALARHGGRAILLVACDMPFVSPQLLRGVADALRDADWAAPVVGGRVHPLCAAYGPRALPVAHALLAQERRSMNALLADAGLAGRSLPPRPEWGDPERLLMNVNTPEDLEGARRLAGG